MNTVYTMFTTECFEFITRVTNQASKSCRFVKLANKGKVDGNKVFNFQDVLIDIEDIDEETLRKLDTFTEFDFNRVCPVEITVKGIIIGKGKDAKQMRKALSINLLNINN